MDMSDTIVPKSDQMNAEDFIPAGPDGARDFTITEVRISDADQPVWIYLAEHPQPWKPAKTVRKLLVLGWGPDQTTYIGRRVRLYNDESIKWAGKPVGGIRMSHMSGITTKITANLSETKGKRVLHVVEPLPDAAPAPRRAPTQRDLLMAEVVTAFVAAGVDDKSDRLDYCRKVIKRDIGNANELTPDEVGVVLDALRQPQAHQGQFAVPPNQPHARSAPAEPSDLDLEPTEAELAASRGDQ
jgi:hypothetical protein